MFTHILGNKYNDDIAKTVLKFLLKHAILCDAAYASGTRGQEEATEKVRF
ncbi:hypothetical protein PRVXH_000308 [Proteinivorax hydrogeniformans]|uniref:Uncharacterized protein n=1 Tax=Proteinivorax hydrogeniformans TaxID=1826727 RepID=A0AAU8HUF7_9FIRM